MNNQERSSTEEIKGVLLPLLLSGHLTTRLELISGLVILADLLEISEEFDFDTNLELKETATTLFVTKCADLVQDEKWDEFLAEIKKPLLKSEQYELLQELSL